MIILLILALAGAITVLLLLFVFDFGPGWGTWLKIKWHELIFHLLFGVIKVCERWCKHQYAIGSQAIDRYEEIQIDKFF